MRAITNGIIESVSLGMEDHGIFTAMVRIKHAGGMQSFGGRAYGQPASLETSLLRELVMRTCCVVGVETWEALPGTHCRVDSDDGRIYKIGHFMDDRWFDPDCIQTPKEGGT